MLSTSIYAVFSLVRAALDLDAWQFRAQCQHAYCHPGNMQQERLGSTTDTVIGAMISPLIGGG
ncbi:hypothetical protein BG74_04210 [Sodalis-like endosymbiont of Proechinophthirus fluctus]|uniref:hypothetical protein n=1 Tax=Sodalis-like endosymbiont of Proechinophthirus fluctus TaxID=1462730 RepID=UPI0007A8AFA7|nr:hypothetical protein [Sodalis-like endosymbiont of Proechinophthirus fluctus]KYP97287.1 hypothetical protein BG74_04210 [Sodalis-like endosymbiont of Proechinophthirus fluctus]